MQPMDEVYQDYADLVYRFLLAKTGNEGIAEELTQETFYQAIRCSAGADIKLVGQDINQLENLVRKTGLSNIVFGEAVESNAQVDFSFSDDTEKLLGFTVVNDAEDEIYGIRISVETENMEAHQAMVEADNSAVQRGLNVDFQLLPQDFEKTLVDGSAGKIRLWVTDENGNEIEVQGEVNADLIWGTQYKVYLSGNADTGYFMGR